MERIVLHIHNILATIGFIGLLVCTAAADHLGIFPALVCVGILAGLAEMGRRKEDE